MPSAISAPGSPTSLSKRYMNERDIEVIAVGVSAGQGKAGVELGSAALLGSGLLERLQSGIPKASLHHDYTVHTYSEGFEPELVEESEKWCSSQSSDSGASTISSMKKPFEVSYATESLHEQVYRQASKGRTILTLGGDHSIAIGSVSGTVRACRERFGVEPAILWIDAHADINPPELSNSGNIHGMPLAFLTGLTKTAPGEPFSWLDEVSEGHDSFVAFSKLVYIGLRDVEPAEQDILDRYGVKSFTARDVHSVGIERVVEEALAHIGQDVPIHLSFDIDSIDPELCPATGTPVPGGLTLEDGRYVCREVRKTGNMISMDLVEVNPFENPDSEGVNAFKTIEAAIKVVESAFEVR